MLSSQQLMQYQRDGFLKIENFISQAQCDQLLSRSHRLIEDFYQHQQQHVVFSTLNQQHVYSDYFLESGDKIHFFYESGEPSRDQQPNINKIGHGLHDVDPIFYQFSRLTQFAELCRDLNITPALLLQSMVICKHAYVGGEVMPHQDSTFLYTHKGHVTGFWLALEDATLENGCLWALPEGHTTLKRRFKREERKTYFETYDDTPWDVEKMQALEATRGSLIILHGLCPHMSKANTSSHSRYAYTLHVAAGDCEYAKDNWLQREKFSRLI
jgi:phytanoyl-CoA hydroxylase